MAVYIGMGSNIDAETNMKKAAAMLRERWPRITFSSVYKTAAREVTDQADFLNAVGMMQTEENPEAIAGALRMIESALRKAPPFKFGPRTIDLDLLLYGNQKIETVELTVPHPRMMERRFVLEPLSELDPSWKDALKNVANQDCEKLAMTL
jgi:2-amino-4-hydroxy-6-hydroxymethyldihydropteridine diphosphokinase